MDAATALPWPGGLFDPDEVPWSSSFIKLDSSSRFLFLAAPSNRSTQVPWSDLPKPALMVLFQQLEQSQRHSLALVCKAWAEAVAATDSIISAGTGQKGSDTGSLQQWLDHHGTSLKKLHVHDDLGLLRSLPCPHLKELVLFVPTQHSHADGAGLAAAASEALQQLRLDTDSTSQAASHQVVKAPDHLLQHLVQLEHLELPNSLSEAALQHISTLTKLNHLLLGHLRSANRAILAGLWKLQGLTFLQLSDLSCSLNISLAPVFWQLSKLQHLQLSWCRASKSMHVLLLDGMTRLQVLGLNRVSLLAADGGIGGAELLETLPSLQELTSLQLSNVSGISECHAVACRCLTSNSKLQRLALHRFRHNGHGGTVWEHIFPAGQPMERITEVYLSTVRPCMTTDDLARLVWCCPGLQQLHITDALHSTAQLTALQHLPQLTALTVLMSDSEAKAALQLTGLKSLAGTACTFKRSTLRQLTTLTQLTALSMVKASSGSDVNWREENSTYTARLFDGDCRKEFVNKAPPGSPPDVCMQLQAAIAEMDEYLRKK